MKIPEGRKAAEEEFARMMTYKTWDDPEERDGIPDYSLLCKLKLLISCKFWENGAPEV